MGLENCSMMLLGIAQKFSLLVLVIAWVAVKFGINAMSVALKMGKISLSFAS